jgi:hypothetical protein
MPNYNKYFCFLKKDAKISSRLKLKYFGGLSISAKHQVADKKR